MPTILTISCSGSRVRIHAPAPLPGAPTNRTVRVLTGNRGSNLDGVAGHPLVLYTHDHTLLTGTELAICYGHPGRTPHASRAYFTGREARVINRIRSLIVAYTGDHGSVDLPKEV
jgi:hypothetical protein